MTRQGWQITGRWWDCQRQRQAIARHRRWRSSTLVAQLSSRNGHCHRSRRSSSVRRFAHHDVEIANSADLAVAFVVTFTFSSGSVRPVQHRGPFTSPTLAGQHSALRRLQHLHGTVSPAGISQLSVTVHRRKRRLRGAGLCPSSAFRWFQRFFTCATSSIEGQETTTDYPSWKWCLDFGTDDDAVHFDVDIQRRPGGWRRIGPIAPFSLTFHGHLRSDIFQRITQKESGIQHRRRPWFAKRIHGHLRQNVNSIFPVNSFGFKLISIIFMGADWLGFFPVARLPKKLNCSKVCKKPT